MLKRQVRNDGKFPIRSLRGNDKKKLNEMQKASSFFEYFCHGISLNWSQNVWKRGEDEQ